MGYMQAYYPEEIPAACRDDVALLDVQRLPPVAISFAVKGDVESPAIAAAMAAPVDNDWAKWNKNQRGGACACLYRCRFPFLLLFLFAVNLQPLHHNLASEMLRSSNRLVNEVWRQSVPFNDCIATALIGNRDWPLKQIIDGAVTAKFLADCAYTQNVATYRGLPEQAKCVQVQNCIFMLSSRVAAFVSENFIVPHSLPPFTTLRIPLDPARHSKDRNQLIG